MQNTGLRPLSVGEILDVSLKLYFSNVLVLAKSVALIVLPVYAFEAVVNLSVMPNGSPNPFLATSPNGTVHPTMNGVAWTAIAGMFVVVVARLLASMVALTAAFNAVSEAYLGSVPNWKRSLRFAMSRLGPLIWISIEASFVLGVAAIFLFLPAIWLVGLFAVTVPVMLFENKKGRRALRRSAQLVRHRWWKTVLTLLAAVILQEIVALVIAGIFGVVVALLVGRGPLLGVLEAAVAALIATVTLPFEATTIAVLYFDLRVRKEGFDLALLAEGLESRSGGNGMREVVSVPQPGVSTGEPPSWPQP